MKQLKNKIALTLLIALATLGLVLTNTPSVSAANPTWDCSVAEYPSGYWEDRCVLEVGALVSEITIYQLLYSPSNTAVTMENEAGIGTRILITDEDSNVTTYDFADIYNTPEYTPYGATYTEDDYNAGLYGKFVFPLDDENFFLFGNYGNIATIEFRIPHSGTWQPDLTERLAHATAMEDTLIEFMYSSPETLNLDYSMYYDATYDRYALSGISETGTLPADTYYINLYIPESIYHTDTGWGIGFYQRATLTVYMEDEELPFVILLSEYLKDINIFDRLDGYIPIAIYDLMQEQYPNESYTVADIDYFGVTIPQSFDSVPDGYIDYIQNNNYYDINSDLSYAAYYVDNLLYDVYVFRNIPLEKTAPIKVGYQFIGWFTTDGIEYDFDRIITEDDLVSNTLFLYAKYQRVATIDTDLDDPTPNNIVGQILAGFNMDNTFGYLLVYIIVAIIGILLMAKWNFDTGIQMIMLLLLTGVWLFLGFLPILAAIMIFGILALMMIIRGRAGGV